MRISLAICAVLAVSVLVAATYFSVYLALVDREPVYYGNGLRVFGSFDQDRNYYPPPPRTPNGYEAKYAFGGPLAESIFQPAYQLDRRIRTDYWPPAKPRWGC